MKFTISSLFVASILLFSNCTNAQQVQRPGGDPVSMADKQTSEMISPLDLTQDQTNKVKEINLKYIKKTQQLREQLRGNKSTAQTLRTTLNNEKNAEMKLVLTEDQYKKYESMMVEIGSRGRGNGGGSRRV